SPPAASTPPTTGSTSCSARRRTPVPGRRGRSGRRHVPAHSTRPRASHRLTPVLPAMQTLIRPAGALPAPDSATDVAIIGAGPYGLSLAAHLRSRGVRFGIFGKPMQAWLDMSPGMYLKSFNYAVSI